MFYCQVMCKISAAVQHYLFLAVHCWALAYSLHLIVKVTRYRGYIVHLIVKITCYRGYFVHLIVKVTRHRGYIVHLIMKVTLCPVTSS